MIAIFDRNSNLVGWFNNQDKNLYDQNMNWLGFANGGNIFNIGQRWLGGLRQGSIVDAEGRPVAWLDGNTPQGCAPLLAPIVPRKPLTPLRPLRPLTPLRPLIPFTPMGGWSKYSWYEYWHQ